MERLLDTREETKLLIEIKDIRDELQIIQSILDIQKEVLENMKIIQFRPRIVIQQNVAEMQRMYRQANTVQDKVSQGHSLYTSQKDLLI